LRTQVLPRLATAGLAARVLALDYGLAPQHGLAAALAHCEHAWRRLAAQLRAEENEDDAAAAAAADGTAAAATAAGGARAAGAARAAGGAGRRALGVGFGRGTRVVLCGDSAGGYLAVALAKRLREDAAKPADAAAADKAADAAPVLMPAALVVLSPWLHLVAPPSGATQLDILSPATVQAFVAALAAGCRADW
jgi:acetyl esterase/lipase